MTPEETLHENIKKVLGLPDEPVAQTASGMGMLHESPLEKIRREAELFLYALGGVSSQRFNFHEVVALMMAFTKHMWNIQEQIRKAYDDQMNRTVMPPIHIPSADLEAWTIKNLVAEAVGSSEVDFNGTALDAVKVLRNRYKQISGQGRKPFTGGAFGT